MGTFKEDEVGRLADVLAEDLRALLQQRPRITKLADLAKAFPASIAAVQSLLGTVQQRAAELREAEMRQQSIVAAAVEHEASAEIERLAALNRRPKVIASKGAFVVAGRITDADTGAGLPNATVKVVDLDRKRDDLLGTVATDDQGYYRVEYRAADFDDRQDQKAELYIQVLDPEGTTIHQSPRSFLEKAGTVSEIDAAVDGTKLPASRMLAENLAALRENQVARLEQKRKVTQDLNQIRIASPVGTRARQRKKQ